MYKKQISINTSVDKVWNALTQPEEMRNWYFSISNFEATEGAVFDFIVSLPMKPESIVSVIYSRYSK